MNETDECVSFTECILHSKKREKESHDTDGMPPGQFLSCRGRDLLEHSSRKPADLWGMEEAETQLIFYTLDVPIREQY